MKHSICGSSIVECRDIISMQYNSQHMYMKHNCILTKCLHMFKFINNYNCGKCKVHWLLASVIVLNVHDIYILHEAKNVINLVQKKLYRK